MLFVEKYVTETPNGQLVIAGFLKTAKGTALSAERLRVIVKGAEILAVGVR